MFIYEHINKKADVCHREHNKIVGWKQPCRVNLEGEYSICLFVSFVLMVVPERFCVYGAFQSVYYRDERSALRSFWGQHISVQNHIYITHKQKNVIEEYPCYSSPNLPYICTKTTNTVLSILPGIYAAWVLNFLNSFYKQYEHDTYSTIKIV